MITGELLIQIRSKDVKVEGLTFRDIELGKVTLLGRGESSSRTSPSALNLNGPIELYFDGVTIPSFLLARKALDAPADRPDKDHDYSSYTGQLTQDALGDHIDRVNSHYFENRNISGGRLLYNPRPVASNKDGFPVDNSGRPTAWDSVNGKWDVFYVEQYVIADFFGHILINPRYYGAESSCPDSGHLTGIEITRNVFERTQIVAVRSTESGGHAFPGDKNCFVEVDITGNTFRNIGIGDDFAYVRDSDGNFITDEDGKRIPNGYAELSEYAIGLFNHVRKSSISDNTIEGTTHSPIAIRNTPEGGRVTVRNNVIRSEPAAAAGFLKFDTTQIGIRGRADDVKIMITGNRLLGSDDSYPYSVTRFDQFRRRAGWCQSPAVPGDASVEQLETLLEPRIWRSYVPDFPYPDGDGVARTMPPDGPPVKLGDVVASYSGTTATLVPNAVIGNYDVVRYRNCSPTTRIEIRNQKGVSVTNNDLGYGEEGFVKHAITLMGVGTALAEFSGNNMDNYVGDLVGSFGGHAETTSVKGNYLGLAPRVSRTTDAGERLSEPIDRGEGDVGPRSGMTVDSPPVLPRIESASVSESGRDMIVVTYNAELDGESAPPATAFAVRWEVSPGRTRAMTASGLVVSGSSITLTFDEEIPSVAGGFTVIYTAPDGAVAVRSMRGGVAARDQSTAVTDSAGPSLGPGPGDGGGTAAPGGGGDGGCALASSGRGGIGLGALLLAMLPFAFCVGRKKKIPV